MIYKNCSKSVAKMKPYLTSASSKEFQLKSDNTKWDEIPSVMTDELADTVLERLYRMQFET